MDGNFKLENLRMRRPQDDVPLRDGRGYMTESEQYAEHLRITPVTKTVRVMHVRKAPNAEKLDRDQLAQITKL
jgi:hypothetical protein